MRLRQLMNVAAPARVGPALYSQRAAADPFGLPISHSSSKGLQAWLGAAGYTPKVPLEPEGDNSPQKPDEPADVGGDGLM